MHYIICISILEVTLTLYVYIIHISILNKMLYSKREYLNLPSEKLGKVLHKRWYKNCTIKPEKKNARRRHTRGEQFCQGEPWEWASPEAGKSGLFMETALFWGGWGLELRDHRRRKSRDWGHSENYAKGHGFKQRAPGGNGSHLPWRSAENVEDGGE